MSRYYEAPTVEVYGSLAALTGSYKCTVGTDEHCSNVRDFRVGIDDPKDPACGSYNTSVDPCIWQNPIP